jgi:uncharacterized RDD family membrane protein YckC
MLEMNSETRKHAEFSDRLFASLIDAIIIGGLTFLVNSINFSIFKSFWIYLLFTLIAMLYKPFMEAKYNATLGKIAMKIEVTDTNYNYIDLQRSLLRSLILIVPSLVYIAAHFFAFNNSYVAESDGVLEFGMRMGEEYPLLTMIASFLSYSALVDVIVYLTDMSKYQRSLKDFIAKTYVVKKQSNTIANNA